MINQLISRVDTYATELTSLYECGLYIPASQLATLRTTHRRLVLGINIQGVAHIVGVLGATHRGALAFIYCGLSMMAPRQDNSAEFYVVLNPTMMGRNLLTVLEQLSLADIHVTGIERNFSEYRLSGESEERRRANGFLSQYGITSDDALNYSSSSILYTFTIGQNYTPSSIKEFITPERMYEHYG